MREMRKAYDLSKPRAIWIAKQIVKQIDIIAAADAFIADEGLIARGGKNGAPYANPVIAVRSKSVEQMMALTKELQAYVKVEDDDDLGIDD